MKLAISISLMETCFAMYAMVDGPKTMSDIYNRISGEHRKQGIFFRFTLDENVGMSEFALDKELWYRLRDLIP